MKISNLFTIISVLIFTNAISFAEDGKTKAGKNDAKMEGKAEMPVAPQDPKFKPIPLPKGYMTVEGKIVKKVKLQGKLVYIQCMGGKMQYNEINNDGTFGKEVSGPQTGQSCTGDWVHKTDQKVN